MFNIPATVKFNGTLTLGAGALTPPIGMAMWLKADSLGMGDGDTITTWPDQSGNGFDVFQSTADNRPIFKLGIRNGLPVVRFDGVDDLLANDAVLNPFPDPASWTIAVAYSTADTTGGRRVVGCNANTLVGPYSGKYQVYDGGFTDGPNVVPGDWVVQIGVHTNGSGASQFLNGELAGSPTAGTQHTGDGIGIGAAFATGEFCTCDVGDVLIYPSALNTANRQALEDYLGAKYSITITH